MLVMSEPDRIYLIFGFRIEIPRLRVLDDITRLLVYHLLFVNSSLEMTICMDNYLTLS